ncbi:MAG: hypothetical protein JXR44_05730 [Thiotrichales bacterium]|nr:hypothetical protein [Thiotrichales bacterium]
MKKPIFAVFFSLFFAFFPVFIAMMASFIAQIYGCDLHEGGVSICRIAGHDWGPMLYQALVAGWLALMTLPIGILAALISGIWFISLRRRK